MYKLWCKLFGHKSVIVTTHGTGTDTVICLRCWMSQPIPD